MATSVTALPTPPDVIEVDGVTYFSFAVDSDAVASIEQFLTTQRVPAINPATNAQYFVPAYSGPHEWLHKILSNATDQMVKQFPVGKFQEQAIAEKQLVANRVAAIRGGKAKKNAAASNQTAAA